MLRLKLTIMTALMLASFVGGMQIHAKPKIVTVEKLVMGERLIETPMPTPITLPMPHEKYSKQEIDFVAARIPAKALREKTR